MRRNKKFLTFMVAASLCAVQFACPMSMVGVAAEQTVYTGTCGTEGDNITWTYDVSTQTMTFSGTGAMNVFSDGEEIPWMSGELSEIYDAKNIIYEEGITDIGALESMHAEDAEHYDVTIPESAIITRTGYVPHEKVGYDVTFHVKYGSQAYYKLHHNSTKNLKNCDIVAEGVAENEFIPTEGETETGLRWNFDYETATLTLEGVDGETTLVLDERGNYRPKLNSSLIFGASDVLDLWLAADTIVIGQDFVIPDSSEAMEIIREKLGNDSIFEHDYVNYVVALLGHYNKKTIYCYENSQFAQEYEAYAASWSDAPGWLQQANEIVYMDSNVDDVVEVGNNNTVPIGDLNMDGNVNLMDAIHLNKYTAKIVDLSDTQRAAADCDGDGLVNDADVTTLMEFLILQIPSLPYTGAEA